MSRAIALLPLLAIAGCAAPKQTGPDSEYARMVEDGVIGSSVNGQPIAAVTVGDGDVTLAVIGGIHGNEDEGLDALAELIDRLRADPPPITVASVLDMNPDSSRRRRHNANDVDLNRNWPAANFRPGPGRGPTALSEPETRAVYDWLAAINPDAIIVLHAISRGGPFVNFDGPAEELATRFATAADNADPSASWRVVPSMGYPTPGSMGSHFGVDRALPILTIEFDSGHDPAGAEAALLAGADAVIEYLSRGDR